MLYRFLVVISCLVACGCGDDGSEDDPSAGGASASASGGAYGSGGGSGGDSTSGGGSHTGGHAGVSTGGSSPSGSGGDSTGGDSPSGGGGTSTADGGTAASGQTGGGGDTATPGDPCSANCPAGAVFTCFGDCPLGECDDSGFRVSTPCSELYPSAVDETTVYCRAGQDGGYCFETLQKDIYIHLIICSNGTPSVTLCDGGCGVDSSGAAHCS